MADNTKIEWADATLNYANGCSVVSPGCTNCYAMRLAGTRMKHHPTRAGLTSDSKAGPVWNGQVRLHEPALLQALAWKRPRRIFWNAHGDIFHENVPDEAIDKLFAVCALTPQHTHMILTKRSARMRAYMNKAVGRVGDTIIQMRRARGDYGPIVPVPSIPLGMAWWPLPNVWLGVSLEDQTRADERIPDLLLTPAAVRFLSCEPLLGPVDLTDIALGRREPRDGTMDALDGSVWDEDGDRGCCTKIDWVIAGGESGPNARPMHPDWARSLRDQCAGAGVPFHFKQWGEWTPGSAFGLGSDRPLFDRSGNVRDWMNRYVVCEDRADRLRGHSFTEHATDLVYRVGKKRAGRMLDGVEHNGMPGVPA